MRKTEEIPAAIALTAFETVKQSLKKRNIPLFLAPAEKTLFPPPWAVCI